jgi:transposase
MPHLVKRIKKGNAYYYLQENQRVNGKVKRIWQIYLGSEKSFKEHTAMITAPTFTVTNFNFGLPVALMQIVDKLDLIGIVDSFAPKRKQGLSVGQYVVLAALNRCIKPVSKEQLRGWFETTYLQHFFPPIDTYLDAMAYTNHFEFLTEDNIFQMQQEIQRRLVDRFGVDMTSVVYDTTNFFTYINPDDDVDLPQHGHSKQNRATLNLVGLSLLCTRDGGVPLHYDVYPGNCQDATQFKAELPRIIDRAKRLGVVPEIITMTFDKGCISPDAFKVIDEAKLHFACSIRPSMTKDLADLPGPTFPEFTLPNGKVVHVHEETRVFYEHPRRLLAVYNPDQAAWNAKNLIAKVTGDVDEIQSFFADRINKKKWRSKDAVQTKVDSMIPKAHRAFITTSVTGDTGQVVVTAAVNQAAIDQHVQTLGKSFIITNHPSMPVADVVWIFRQQIMIERAFSYLKSPDIVSVRPIFHRIDDSIRGHVFSCVLGLLLLTLLVRNVQKTKPDMAFFDIIENLASITASCISFSGTSKIHKKIAAMSPEAESLCQELHLESSL